MAEKVKKEYKTVILNGTKVWLTCIMFLIGNMGTGIWWASSINTQVKTLKETTVEMKKSIEKNSDSINELVKELRRDEVFKKSA